MKVAVVAPQPVPDVWGGTERAVAAMREAIAATGDHECDLIKLPVDEFDLPGLIDGYRRFAHLDLSAYDRVISVKYPAWMIDHPDHVVHMFHPLRGLYDAYGAFGLPLVASPVSPRAAELLEIVGTANDRAAVDEFFDGFAALVAAEGPHAPDLVFPGPFARAVVHWLDRIALTPPRVRRHFAISATVAVRPEYFPRGISPVVLSLPTDLPTPRPPDEPGGYLFTASRLDAPKRLDLLVDAMAHVPADVELRIAGRGPLSESLRERAAADPRIVFLGFVDEEELITQYRGAIAVPFVPFDEDQGLICAEAASQGTPVVTCDDAGGPTEFVVDGVNGLITAPTPESVGRGLERITSDPTWARRMGHAAHRRASVRTWRRAARILLDDGTRTHRPIGTTVTADRPPTVIRSRPRAVVLATYGIARPAHGGQLRVHHLCNALAPLVDVDVLALSGGPGATQHTRLGPGLTSTVVSRSDHQIRIEDDLGILAGQPLTDVLSGVDAHFTPEFLERLQTLTGRADLVILAQPFLHPALVRTGVDLPLLVDTQNVEIDLRVQSLADTPMTEPLLDLLRRVEGDALAAASALSACSSADADRLADLYGLDRAGIAVIPNGTDVPTRRPDPDRRVRARRRWFERFRWNGARVGGRELGVFFGSWHPPNIDAAEFLIELAGRMPELFIVSAGDHGTALDDRDLPENILFPGVVSETVKSTLLACASVALNPMRIGSGTNLKLIEFLAHGTPTVTTPFGTRGLDVVDGRELVVAEPDGFAAAVARLLEDPDSHATRSAAGWRFARRYDWQVIGADYRELVRGILGVPLAA